VLAPLTRRKQPARPQRARPTNASHRLSTAGAARDVAAIVDHYRTRAAPLASRPVGRIAATFDRSAAAGGDHALGRLIADAQLAATRDKGAVIAFTNPGGIRTELKPGPGGAVSYGDLTPCSPSAMSW
jgi:5'-nucleotidase